jgi:hypothetical protein
MKYLILGSRGQMGSTSVEYIGSKSHTATHYDILDGSIFDLRQKWPWFSEQSSPL